jgi:hypothetical protein
MSSTKYRIVTSSHALNLPPLSLDEAQYIHRSLDYYFHGTYRIVQWGSWKRVVNSTLSIVITDRDTTTLGIFMSGEWFYYSNGERMKETVIRFFPLYHATWLEGSGRFNEPCVVQLSTGRFTLARHTVEGWQALSTGRPVRYKVSRFAYTQNIPQGKWKDKHE